MSGDVTSDVMSGDVTSDVMSGATTLLDNVSEFPVITSRILSNVPGFERVLLWQIYLLLVVVGLLTLFAIAANGLVLFVLCRHSCLRKAKNLHFHILLTLSLMNAVLYYCYLLLTYLSDFAILDSVCFFFYGSAIEVIYNVSMTIMLGMCLERLVSIVEPLWFSTVWLEESYSRFLILAMLIIGVVPVVLPILAGFVEFHHIRKWMYCRLSGDQLNLKLYIWINICFIYVPCIVGVVVVYLAVQIKATQSRRFSKQFREECKFRKHQTENHEAGPHLNLEKLKKALFNSRVTILLLCLFLVTKLPIAVLTYAHYFNMSLPLSVRNCEFIGNLCRFFFSIVAPFLFPLLNTPLKNKVLDVLCRNKSEKSTHSSLGARSVPSIPKSQVVSQSY